MSDDALTPAFFTPRELEAVRRCCRDADASLPLKSFDAALARAERELASFDDARDAVAPKFSAPAPSKALPLPPHPGKR